MSAALGFIYARRDYAGFWRRSVALAIDLLLFWGGCYASLWLWWQFAPIEWLTETAAGRIIVVVWLTWNAYFFGMRLTEGGALGYRLVGIRYAPMRDVPTGVLDRLLRTLWAAFLLFGFVLDHAWILFDENRQAWHDKLSGFYVIRRAAQPLARVPIRRRVIGFLGLTFVVFEPDPVTQPSAADVS